MNLNELYHEITSDKHSIQHKGYKSHTSITSVYILRSDDNKKFLSVSKTLLRNVPVPPCDRIEYEVTGTDHTRHDTQTEYHSPVAKQLFNLINRGRSGR